MNHITILLASLLFISNCILNAQENPYRFGDISESDLKMTSYSPEPDADAVILAKSRIIESTSGLGPVLFFQNFERIKILKSSGLEYSNVNLEYMHYGRTENITDLKGLITYPDGSLYYLTKKDFKRFKIDNSWSIVSFSFPNAVPGCIIEYSYSLTSSGVNLNEDFVFQFDIPLREAVFGYNVKKDFDYEIFAEGQEYIETTESLYLIKNVPSMKKGPFMTNISDYRGKIKFRIKGHNDDYGVTSNYLVDAEELSNDRFYGGQIEKPSSSNYIVKKAKSFLEKETDVKKKIIAIQKFIHANVAWDSTHTIFSEEGIVRAFRSKSVSSSEINFIAISLLKYIGVECYPVLIRTRDKGKLYGELPNIGDFDYTIIMGKVGGEEMLMDFSSPYLAIGDVRFEALNRRGLMIVNEKASWIQIQARTSFSAAIAEFEIDNNDLSGIIKTKFEGNVAANLRDEYNKNPYGMHRQRNIRKKFPRALISNIALENEFLPNESLKEEIEIQVPGAIETINDSLFIDPIIIADYIENPFKVKERNYEINLGYPQASQYIFQLLIPDQYEIASVPERLLLINESRSISYQYDVNIVGDKIQMVKNLIFSSDIYPKEEHEALKALFQSILAKEQEKIVLVRISAR